MRLKWPREITNESSFKSMSQVKYVPLTGLPSGRFLSFNTSEVYALVAKIIGDHGGIIECDSRPRRTTFRALMPMQGAGTYGNGGGE